MNVKLISVTQTANDLFEQGIYTAEGLIIYCARVSSPQNQTNIDTGAKLIAYCIKNKHWSIFEQASMTVEIETSRAIAQQILRHRSFSFQEFSQRYAKATAFEDIDFRQQGATNRQGGEDQHPNAEYWNLQAIKLMSDAQTLYNNMVAEGVAKECARFILPLTTQTRLYMTGSVRSWIHYLQQRLDSHAQKEHRLVAEKIRDIFAQQFPSVWEALNS